MSKSALTPFTDAFGFGTVEREQLGKLREGSAHVRVLSGPTLSLASETVAGFH
jgi:hypothetical protein